MIYGIPNFKLEKFTVERRTNLLKESGIKFKQAFEVGKDISLDEGNILRKVLTKKGTGKEARVKKVLRTKFIDGVSTVTPVFGHLLSTLKLYGSIILFTVENFLNKSRWQF